MKNRKKSFFRSKQKKCILEYFYKKNLKLIKFCYVKNILQKKGEKVFFLNALLLVFNI